MTALPWQSQPDDPADYISTLALHVCQLICTEDVKAYEIALAIREARLECARLLPEKIELFDLVYGARFERLKQQFRE